MITTFADPFDALFNLQRALDAFQLSTSRWPITPSFGTKRTSQLRSPMSAFGGKADIGSRSPNVCF
jgi:hypothetical protein